MPLRIKHKVNLRAWEEQEQLNALFAPDDVRSEITIDNMEHLSSGKITVEDATNEDIPLPDIQTVCGVFIMSDQDIDLKLDGEGTPHHLKRPSPGTSDAPTYCKFFFEGSLTSVNVAKPHTDLPADANVRWVVWGNPET
jgi:hypothetical protein